MENYPPSIAVSLLLLLAACGNGDSSPSEFAITSNSCMDPVVWGTSFLLSSGTVHEGVQSITLEPIDRAGSAVISGFGELSVEDNVFAMDVFFDSALPTYLCQGRLTPEELRMDCEASPLWLPITDECNVTMLKAE